MKMRPITKAEMELLDKLYVERCNEPELDPLLKELRELVLGKINIFATVDPKEQISIFPITV